MNHNNEYIQERAGCADEGWVGIWLRRKTMERERNDLNCDDKNATRLLRWYRELWWIDKMARWIMDDEMSNMRPKRNLILGV